MVTSTDSALFDAAFEPLVAAAADNARALATLAVRASQTGDQDRAKALAEQAQALAPDDNEVAVLAHAITGARIPRWHFPMMRDDPRNAAYQAAIERAVKTGMRVLDIGSGSGLLAMMAARAGAAHVVTCEADPAIAAVAAQIVAANGFADRITVIARHSSDLDVDADLGGPVDLIVSELVGKDLVCEQVLPSLADARRRFLKPGGTMVPAFGEIVVALGWWGGFEHLPAQADQCGFDLSAFNQLLPPRWSTKVGDPRLVLRSPGDVLMRFDLGAPVSSFGKARLTLVSDGGPVNGVIQWIRLQFDAEGWYENRPEPGSDSHWACLFYPFAQPQQTRAGEQIAIAGRAIGDLLRIWKD